MTAPTRDQRLAARYAGRESATARAARKAAEKAARRRAKYFRQATAADRAGWAWWGRGR